MTEPKRMGAFDLANAIDLFITSNESSQSPICRWLASEMVAPLCMLRAAVGGVVPDEAKPRQEAFRIEEIRKAKRELQIKIDELDAEIDLMQR